MPKGFGYGGESANQEKKNLNKDMPVVKQASWMSKHSMAAGSPVAMGGSYKGSAMEMHKPGHIDPKVGKKKVKKEEDDFDYTPSIPDFFPTGTMVTETVGAKTGRPFYEKPAAGGGFVPKEAGEPLVGGGRVLESKKVGSNKKILQKVRALKYKS